MAFLGLKKVMLIDSDGDVSPQCERVLKRCGVTEIIKPRNLRAAGARLASTDAIDFMLVDVDLKELSGESISSTLMDGGSSNASNIPTLFIANVKTRAEVQELQDAGCYHFLMKPLNDNLLEGRIREILERSFDSSKELEIITEVKSAIAEKNLAEAESILKPVLRKYPTSPKFQTLLAEIVFFRNDVKTAFAITEKVLKSDPEFRPALELKQLIQNKINQEKQAQLAASKASENARFEKELQSKRDLAKNYVKGNQLERAEAIFLELLTKATGTPSYFNIQFELAESYFAGKKFEKAKAAIADLQRASPKNLVSQIEGLLAQITHEEELIEEEKTKRGYAYAELAKATDFPLPEDAEATDFTPEEEDRILKYIMFEGKL